jgi:hypothetical protein
MSCTCGSNRIGHVSGKCSDQFNIDIELENGTIGENGYVPRDLNIGGGDYLKFSYCLDCGLILGNFPLEKTELEKTIEPFDE